MPAEMGEEMTGKWLGCQDSNLGMAVPKTAALPLGHTPAEHPEVFAERLDSPHRNAMQRPPATV
jgi:hypothetical protein